MKPYRTNRSRAYYRHHRRRAIRRKMNIAKARQWQWNPPIALGKWSKGKIHCSCWMCAVKTKKDGYSHSQFKRLCALQCQLNEYIENN
ncbi:hypothetical protein [Metasolibacillus meyeri]|uniref:hypothetical protein n=1 Tax=Metasolibacillus meyeri TaxID=1071052 RepID=UPI001EE6F26F|nr:hypothetical protein [Metasolibacillus meyeri]